MKTYDIWNHPLVVKAGRVQYRRLGIFSQAGIVLFLLIAGMIFMQQFQDVMGGPLWLRNYFIAMFCVQCGLSAFTASAKTANSMNAEVSKHTLDFQRITGLSPRQILVGKALGEPVSLYVLVFVTIPIAGICCSMGGIDPLVAALLYVSLLTSIFLMASVGLQHTLKQAEKSGLSQSGGNIGIGLGGFFYFMIVVWMSSGMNNQGAMIFGLFTPVPALHQMVISNSASGTAAWNAAFPFLGIDIPFLILTPISQLLIAAFFINIMARRLTHPLDTGISKWTCYGLVGGGVLIATAPLYAAVQTTNDLTGVVIGFSIGLIPLVLAFVYAATPGQETYQSWIWRFRGRRGAWADLLYGERTLNPVSLVVSWLLGAVLFAASMTIILRVAPLPGLKPIFWPAVAIAFSLSFLVTICYGLTAQAIGVASGKVGAGILVGVFIFAVIAIIPIIAGDFMKNDIVTSLSPIGTWMRLMEKPRNFYSPIPILAIHLLMSLFWAWGLKGMTDRYKRIITQKREALEHVD